MVLKGADNCCCSWEESISQSLWKPDIWGTLKLQQGTETKFPGLIQATIISFLQPCGPACSRRGISQGCCDNLLRSQLELQRHFKRTTKGQWYAVEINSVWRSPLMVVDTSAYKVISPANGKKWRKSLKSEVKQSHWDKNRSITWLKSLEVSSERVFREGLYLRYTA